MDKMSLKEKQRVHLRKVLAQKVGQRPGKCICINLVKESEFLRSKRMTIDKSQFATVKIIGRGAFGEV